MKKYILALLTASNIAHGAALGAGAYDLDALIGTFLPQYAVHPTLQIEIETNIHRLLQPLVIAHAGAILNGREDVDISEFLHTITFLENGIVGGITPAFITLTKGMNLRDFRAAADVLAAIALDNPGLINAMAADIPGHATAAQRATLIQNLVARPQATWAAEIARIVPAAAPAFGGAGLGALDPAVGGAGLGAVAPQRAIGGVGGAIGPRGLALIGGRVGHDLYPALGKDAIKPAAMPTPEAAGPLMDEAEKAMYARGKNVHADDRVNETNVGAFEFFKALAPFADKVRGCAYSEENRKYEYAQLLDLEAYIRKTYVDEAVATLTGVSREQAITTREAALWTLFGPHIPMFDAIGNPRRDLTKDNNNDFGPLLGERFKLFEIPDADLAMAAFWWFINNINTPGGYELPPQPATAGKTPEQIRQGLRIDLVRALQNCIDTPDNPIPQISGNSRVCPDGKGQRLVQILRGILPEVGAEAGTTEALTLGHVPGTLGNYCTAIPDILRARGEKLKRIEVKHHKTGAIIEVTEQPTRLQYIGHVDEFLSKLFIKPEEYLEFRKQFLQELDKFFKNDPDDLGLVTDRELTPEELAEGRNILTWDEAREMTIPTMVPEAILATARAHTTKAKTVFNRLDFIKLWRDTFRPLDAYGKQLAATTIPIGMGAVGGAGARADVAGGLGGAHADGGARAAAGMAYGPALAAPMGGAGARRGVGAPDPLVEARARFFVGRGIGDFGGARAGGGAGARRGVGAPDPMAEAHARLIMGGGFGEFGGARAGVARGVAPAAPMGGGLGGAGAAVGVGLGPVLAAPMGGAGAAAGMAPGPALAAPAFDDPRIALAQGRYRIDHLPAAYKPLANTLWPKFRGNGMSEHEYANAIRGYLEANPGATPESLEKQMKFW